MTTEVVLTGTGTPNPVPDRAGAGTLIRHGDCLLQFDAGRSTLPRLTSAGVDATELTAFFATHHHSDHLTGLQDLVLTRWLRDRGGVTPPLPIVVPEGPLERFVGKLLDPWEDDIADRSAHSGDEPPSVDLTAFPVPTDPVEVWSQGDVRVFAGPVRHEPIVPAVGFRIETPDGVIAISGDTRVCEEMTELARGADVLVHEAIRVELIERVPHLRFIIDYHADTRLLGEQARALGVPTLVLTHLIPPPSNADEAAAFERDIREGGFEGRVVVGNDLDVVRIGTD